MSNFSVLINNYTVMQKSYCDLHELILDDESSVALSAIFVHAQLQTKLNRCTKPICYTGNEYTIKHSTHIAVQSS